ncbi:MAG: SDR family NAD(P)-dependent oxidoreductase, partial [Gammaproteobacteria bacterium]|nr:SDR family NAD(P)-dependent oxidoreductase [Gammaproteobacteria bacterium]
MSEVAVITGTTHGIGRVTGRELARAGKAVIMLCRNVTAALAVRDEINRQVPRATVEVVRCDLASLSSVREAAAAVRRDYPPLALL